MKHPQNKKARFLIGFLKGLKRAKSYDRHNILGAAWILKYSRKLRRNSVLCSEYCCGNPRKHFKKKTKKETGYEEKPSCSNITH